MSETQRTLAAKEYVDQQLDAMRQNGMLSAELSQEEYQGLVEEIASGILSTISAG
jgi:hypothetical protein